jgi:type IV pilus assembly protein PilQ
MNNITKITKTKILFIWIIFFLYCMPSLAAGAAAPTIIADSKPLTALEARMQKKITISVSDARIDTVIKQLTEQVNVDFIISPKVQGNVTVTLNNVSVEEALQSILDVHGCACIKGENVIKILTREEMPAIAERLKTDTFEIIYANVDEVVKALDKFKSNQGSVSSIQGTSHIIVTDTENKIREIAKLIEKIDRITPQVLVEARIYDITSQDDLDIGIQWQAGRNTTFSGTNVGLDPTAGRTNPYSTATFSDPTITDNTLGFLKIGVLNDHLDIDSKITAIKQNVDAKLLANPRIIVLDNESALFDIVTEYPYIEQSINGSTVTETVKFKNVGVKLGVTPHVTRDGMVKMHIQPEFGVKTGKETTSSGSVPIVDTRKVDTTTLVKNGQSIVLGGLRKKGTNKQVNKVPLLGDLPIIGVLFRFEGESTAVTELVVFITPSIITEPTLTKSEQKALNETQFDGPEPSYTRAEQAISEADSEQ